MAMNRPDHLVRTKLSIDWKSAQPIRTATITLDVSQECASGHCRTCIDAACPCACHMPRQMGKS